MNLIKNLRLVLYFIVFLSFVNDKFSYAADSAQNPGSILRQEQELEKKKIYQHKFQNL